MFGSHIVHYGGVDNGYMLTSSASHTGGAIGHQRSSRGTIG